MFTACKDQLSLEKEFWKMLKDLLKIYFILNDFWNVCMIVEIVIRKKIGIRKKIEKRKTTFIV